MLVTSRERLRLKLEREFPAPPLGLPAPEHLPSPEDLAEYPAVALFVERVRNSEPAFRITAENAAVISEICARLDGLPLAIELAAVRLGMLSPTELLARLERHGLRLLSGGARDLPERQRTLRDTMDWSYDLLGEFEKILFRRSSVFVRGCLPEAVEALYVAYGELPSGVLDGLGSLVDKNLLRRADLPNGEVRLGMLETVRQYALETLSASGEEEATRKAHAATCLSIAEEIAPELTRADRTRHLDRLETELDNLRAALSWALDAGCATLGLRLAVALEKFWQERGHLTEAVIWFENLLEIAAGESMSLRTKALGSAGRLAIRNKDYSAATLFLKERLSLLREVKDDPRLASALDDLAAVAMLRGESDFARSLLEESLMLHRKLGAKRETANSLLNLGVAAMAQGDYEKSAFVPEESASSFEDLKDGHCLAAATAHLGFAALHRGRHESAAASMKEALALFVARKDQTGMAYCLEGLACLAAGRRERGRAARLYSAARALRDTVPPPEADPPEPPVPPAGAVRGRRGAAHDHETGHRRGRSRGRCQSRPGRGAGKPVVRRAHPARG